MDVTAAGATDYGLLNRLVSDSSSVRQRLDTLTQQASTGQIADTYAGLGAGARTSLDLRPLIAHQQAWQNGIDAATGKMTVAQTAITQIQQIASNLVSQLNDLNGLNAESVDTVAASARESLRQVAGLLDTKDGDTYVFAGQDSANEPVPDPDNIVSSGFFTQINAAVSGLGSNASTVTAATLALASSNASGTSPFSASQSQPAGSIAVATVETGQGQRSQVGLLASANSFATSTGTSTTGSYMRDVLRALATVGSLTSSQITAGGFGDLVQDVRTSLNGAISAMGEDAGVLGNTATRLGNTKTQLGDMSTALTTQVSSAEDVDMASTLSQITLTQTQLQASYQLISGMQNLSLVKYLS
jgi:flagellar hook-associated protein 3 FlgL